VHGWLRCSVTSAHGQCSPAAGRNGSGGVAQAKQRNEFCVHQTWPSTPPAGSTSHLPAATDSAAPHIDKLSRHSAAEYDIVCLLARAMSQPCKPNESPACALAAEEQPRPCEAQSLVLHSAYDSIGTASTLRASAVCADSVRCIFLGCTRARPGQRSVPKPWRFCTLFEKVALRTLMGPEPFGPSQRVHRRQKELLCGPHALHGADTASLRHVGFVHA